MIKSLAAIRASFAAHPPALPSQFSEGDPRRVRQLSLEQQKRQAKERLRTWRSSGEPTRREVKLSDAQHAIAREAGFANWMQLKAHIEQSRAARDALESGSPEAPDGNRHVLHVRCGTDIMHTLAVAGFNGDFLAFYDPFVHGPVPPSDSLESFLRIRAGYISCGRQPNHNEVLNDLRRQYAALDRAGDYEAVYLWFEHDPFDQLILAKLLDNFRQAWRSPPSLKLICVTHYPGVAVFNGIGQLPPAALRILWRNFTEVTPEQLSLGSVAWNAIRSPTPDALYELIATGTPALPMLATALDRHLKQLPFSRNGLNLSENLTLQILDEKGAMNAARLFGWYTNHYEPLTFMGDTFYWRLLEQLATGVQPAVNLHKRGDKPNQWWISLSEIGRRLLANEVDWVEINGIDRWVGGIHLNTQQGAVYRYMERG
jgi:hypothetical protein